MIKVYNDSQKNSYQKWAGEQNKILKEEIDTCYPDVHSEQLFCPESPKLYTCPHCGIDLRIAGAYNRLASVVSGKYNQTQYQCHNAQCNKWMIPKRKDSEENNEQYDPTTG